MHRRSLMILTSGPGAILADLCGKIWFRKLDAKIVCAVGDRSGTGAEKVSARWRVPYWCLDTAFYPPRDKWNETFEDLVGLYRPSLIVLDEYNGTLSVPPAYEDRVIVSYTSIDIPSRFSDDTIGGLTIKVYGGDILSKSSVSVPNTGTGYSLMRLIKSHRRHVLHRVIAEYMDSRR